MSTAMQAAGEVHAVGIDAPNRVYLRLLVAQLATRPLTGGVIPSVLTDLLRSSAQAVACRVGALVGSITPLRLRVYSPIAYDATLLDSPSEQVTHEAELLSQQRAFVDAIQIPQSNQVIDRAREESLVARLRDLRMDGDVIAVVGLEHIDAIEELLSS